MKLNKVTTTITLKYEYPEDFEGDEIGIAAEIESAICGILQDEGLGCYPNSINCNTYKSEVVDG